MTVIGSLMYTVRTVGTMLPFSYKYINANTMHRIVPVHPLLQWQHATACDCGIIFSRWRHQMEAFSALLALCVGNSPVTGDFPSQRTSNAELWCFFDVGESKWLNKMSSWWFETQWHPVWCHFNAIGNIHHDRHVHFCINHELLLPFE